MDEAFVTHCYVEYQIQMVNDISNIHLLFPEYLVLIIAKYLQNEFEWDPAYCSDGIELCDSNLNAKCNIGCNTTMISKNVISSVKYARVEWEVTVTNFKQICIAFGFIEHPITKSVKDINNGNVFLDQAHQHSVYIHDSGGAEYFEVCDGPTPIHKVYKNPANVKNGDKFKLVFDFRKMKCDFYYNDQFQATLANNMEEDGKFVPAMACCTPHQIECTSWRLHYSTY
eukprot:247802_1